MSDSGRVIGDCQHGRNPWWCCECLQAERNRLEQRLAHCHDWYAVRWERLRKLIHDDARHIEDEACDVMANGATTPDDPPTYAQRLAEKDHLIAAARKDHRTALKDVENLRRMVDGLTAQAGLPWPASQCRPFAREAEQGWPAAIRRAEYAEAENKRLRAALDDLWHFYDYPGAGSLPKTVARRVCEALGRPVPEHYQGDEWDG